MQQKTLSIVIPTYKREQVLLDTIQFLLTQMSESDNLIELIIVDQTADHDQNTEQVLYALHKDGEINWIQLKTPHLVHAMNIGLCEAKADIVLFTDDDIIPHSYLLKSHIEVYSHRPEVSAVVGQVLQPGEQAENIPYQVSGKWLFRFMDFPFRRTEEIYIENAMAGNLSVVKDFAISIGGFDESFPAPVASRFETEFAKRMIKNGGKILFEPAASIDHLQAQSGGTRSKGSHLTSASPVHGVGDYYYALRQGQGWERVWYIVRKPFREVRTKFHLRHPWWIPVKLVGEVRAFIQALGLYKKPPTLLSDHHCNSSE